MVTIEESQREVIKAQKIVIETQDKLILSLKQKLNNG
jgi:hypothetical protein